jgi:BolA family transcriptional regulator, general stress-responsive regulator
MSFTEEIKQKLENALEGSQVEVLDESSLHFEHNATGAHLAVTISFPGFDGKSMVEQHQMIYKVLEEEMKGQIHALKIKIQ